MESNYKSRSAELNELFSALAKAQDEMNIAGMNASNPFFKSKYADLADIVKASRPALTKHGLSITQPILPTEDGQSMLHTILGHSSGQWLESRMKIMPSKPDVQSLGSYITYIRRYAYASICGIVASNEDDDGEVAMSPERYKNNQLISPEQLKRIEIELEQMPDIKKIILEGMKIKTLADIPKDKVFTLEKYIKDKKDIIQK